MRRATGGLECHGTVEHQRIHADAPTGVAERGEGDAGVVGRDVRRERDAAEPGDLVRTLAVVVHLPNLLGAALGGDVEDMRLGDAVDSTAEAEDDLVGEAVGDEPGIVLGRGLVVLLAEDLRRLRVLGVEEPAGDDYAATVDGQGPEGHHLRVRRGVGPFAEVDLLRRRGRRGRRDALRDQVEDACVVQVVEEGRVEGGFERRGLWVLRGGREIGGGDPDLLSTEVGSGAHPVLGAGCRGAAEQNHRRSNQSSEEKRSMAKIPISLCCHAYLMSGA